VNLSPIKKVRVYEQVIEQIKELIEQGVIQPGQKLPSERELATELSVSRSVVREAMSVLNTSGIIQIRPGIGVFLMEEEEQGLIHRINRILNKDEINLSEVLELRQGLEVQAAFLAAQRATEKDLQVIEAALKELEQAVYKKKLAAEEDFAFHLAIIRASKNAMIQEMMHLLTEAIQSGMKKSRRRTLQMPKKPEEVVNEHFEIYQAIRNNDGQTARELMLLHLDNVIKRSYLVQ